MSEYNSDALIDLLKLLSRQNYINYAITPHSHAIVNARPDNLMAKDSIGALGWSREFTASVSGDELFNLLQKAKVLEVSEHGWKCKIRVSTYDNVQFIHSSFPTNHHDSVFFGPDTYRFVRAIELHLSDLNPAKIKRAVDICSGSGIAAIIMGLAMPDCEVIGVDINDRALELSRINALAANACNVEFLKSDLLKNVEGQFDLIVANPPYLIDKLEREYRHGGGEFGEQLSLDIIDTALARLAPNGTLLLYTGSVIVNGRDSFKEKLNSKLSRLNQAYTYQELDPDVFGEELLNPVYAGCDRIAAVLVKFNMLNQFNA
ncbi:MAG: class I SAM-dependent methyltransferase [Pseudomonadota bacterium]